MSFLLALKNAAKINPGRWLLYDRYAIPFCILIILSGVIILFREGKQLNKIIVFSFFVSLIAFKFFFVEVVQFLTSGNIYSMASIFKMFFHNNKEDASLYFGALLFFQFLIFVLIIGALMAKRERTILVVYMLVSVLFWISSFSYKEQRHLFADSKVDASIKAIAWAKDMGIDIYVTTEYGNAPSYVRYLQTSNALEELKYLRYENIDYLKDEILLTDLSKIESDGTIFSVRLDDNEYAYSRNNNYLENLSKAISE